MQGEEFDRKLAELAAFSEAVAGSDGRLLHLLHLELFSPGAGGVFLQQGPGDMPELPPWPTDGKPDPLEEVFGPLADRIRLLTTEELEKLIEGESPTGKRPEPDLSKRGSLGTPRPYMPTKDLRCRSTNHASDGTWHRLGEGRPLPDCGSVWILDFVHYGIVPKCEGVDLSAPYRATLLRALADAHAHCKAADEECPRARHGCCSPIGDARYATCVPWSSACSSSPSLASPARPCQREAVGDTGSYHSAPQRVADAPAGCPVDHDWSPLNADYLDDPYPIAHRLRDESPIFFAEQIGYVVVTRMEDIVQVFTNPDVFASTNVQDPVFPLSAAAADVLSAPDFNPVAVMSNRPEPDHARIRVHTRAGFSRRRLRTLEPYIVARSHELIDGMLAGPKPTEFIEAFAFPLPGETVFRFIGFPEGDDELLKNWCSDRKAFSWGRPTSREQVAIAEKMLAYWRYCREFTAAKRANPADDFASELIAAHEADPDDLSYLEVESVIYGLSFAGHEAVTALICNALVSLLTHRDRWNELVADPTLIPNAVEEVVRFNSSQISWRRITTEDTTLAGVDVPAQTPILMNFASANRQPDIFPEPDDFDIHRENAAHNISFGKGIHYCLGAGLAKLEVQLVLEVLTERVPSLRMVPEQKLWSSPNITFRGPEQLLVDWD